MGPGSSFGSTIRAGCREQLPQDGDQGLRHCHTYQLALALGTPWALWVLEPPSASLGAQPALGVVRAEAIASCPGLGLLPAAAPLPPPGST